MHKITFESTVCRNKTIGITTCIKVYLLYEGSKGSLKYISDLIKRVNLKEGEMMVRILSYSFFLYRWAEWYFLYYYYI